MSPETTFDKQGT
jgi:aubergine-like protein